MLNGLLLWAGGLIVGIIAKDVLPKAWKKLMVKFRKSLKDKAVIYLKDPVWKSIVSQIVLKVQKDLSTESNETKLRQAVDWIVKVSPLPDVLERPIIEAMVELVIAEIKNPIEI